MSDTPGATPPAADGNLPVALIADQCRRWQRGERVLVEAYLEHHPGLRADSDALLDLLYNEFLLRRECGEGPHLDEYLERFPDLAAQLRVQFAVDEALQFVAAPPATSGAPTRPAPLGSGPQTAAPAAGDPQVVGHYQVLGVLGRGGMGVAYKAWQAGVRRLVTLKMIRAGDQADPASRARFRIEAEAVGRLQHPNIVQVHEVGEHDGQPFLALEFVEGGSLAQRLDGIPVAARAAAELVEALARAVHYAHQRGIVHRDLKPANILLAACGLAEGASAGAKPQAASFVPKVTDFGLAKLLEERAGGVTQSGAVLGTPSYMAPEQAAGKKDVGPAADTYALGAILYELLSGRPPFKAESVLATLAQVCSQEPVPVRQLRPKLPRDLETVCLKCLQKEPPKRYASALALADDLRRFLDGKPVAARPVGAAERVWRWARRNPALAAVSGATLASLLLTVGVTTWFAVYQYREAARLDAARKETDRLLIQSGIDRAGSLCEQGDVDQGMLWWADSLQRAERAGDADAERVIRTNLTSWQQQLHTLHGCLEHAGAVADVAFAPDSRRAATAGADGRAQLWDVATGGKVGEPLPHPGPVSKVIFSPDGKLLLIVSGRSAFLWDAASGTPLGRPPLDQGAAITAVAFPPHGSSVLLAGDDGVARLWDTATGRPIGSPLRHEGRIFAAAFSPDGRLLVTGSADHTARLWRADTGEPVAVPPLQHADAVRAVAFRPDGAAVVTGSADSTAQVWRAADGARVGPPLPHNGTVTAVCFSPDGATLVTAGQGWKAFLWDAAGGTPQAPPRATLGHLAPVRGLQLGPGGRTLLTGSLDGKARLWDLASGKLLGCPPSHIGEVRAVALSPDGRWALTAAVEPAARLWELASPPEPPMPLDHPGWSPSLAFSPDGRLLAMPGEDHGVQLWDVETNQKRCLLPHPGVQRALAFSPDGERLATGGEDHQARLWDVARGCASGSPLRHAGEVSAAAFSPDGRTLWTGTQTGTVTRWDAATGNQLGQFRAHEFPVWSLVLGPHGRFLATGSADQTARLWDAATGELRATLRHQGQVWSVAFSPDGTAVLTGSEDRTARLWEASSGRPLGAPFRAGMRVRTAAFSPDGRAVVLGSWDGAARLWDVPSRKPLAAPFGNAGGPVLAAAFVEAGARVRTAAEDKTVLRWEVPVPTPGTAERALLWAQVISGMELEAGGTARVLDAPTWQERRQRLQQLDGPP